MNMNVRAEAVEIRVARARFSASAYALLLVLRDLQEQSSMYGWDTHLSHVSSTLLAATAGVRTLDFECSTKLTPACDFSWLERKPVPGARPVQGWLHRRIESTCPAERLPKADSHLFEWTRQKLQWDQRPVPAQEFSLRIMLQGLEDVAQSLQAQHAASRSRNATSSMSYGTSTNQRGLACTGTATRIQYCHRVAAARH
nr:hypothetical protein CFP56_24415 [Quercus suber]